MVNAIKKLLGFGPAVDYARLVSEGAVILDVRTPAEFESGHIAGAVNIPIEILRDQMNRLDNKQKAIIACCNDGSRSWYAKNLLDSTGYKSVFDAGNWSKLQVALQRR